MKKAGKKFPKEVKASLAYGAKNLVPFILQQGNSARDLLDGRSA
jgi:hypothetical protein